MKRRPAQAERRGFLGIARAAWLDGKGILMHEPRHIAARNAARYMASLLGEKVGQTVGYRVRLDSRVSASTRITVVTEGVLTRMLQDDPELQGVGCLIFDEFHERSLNADLGLALALDCQQGLRDDLRLLIMSATLDSGPLLKLLQQDFRSGSAEARARVARGDAPSSAAGQHSIRGGLRTPSGARCGRNGGILVFLRERAKSEELKRYFKTCDRIPYIFVRCTAICPQRSRMPPLRRFGLRYGR
ncbi:MAG: DEAD/DEAH box helicase [Bilophila wadsworthia]